MIRWALLLLLVPAFAHADSWIDSSHGYASVTGSAAPPNGMYAPAAATTSISASGNSVADFATPSNAVNKLVFTGGATGVAPTIAFDGTDTNISATYRTKGGGAHYFVEGDGSIQMAVTATGSAVNYSQMSGSTAGNPVIWSTQGSDTDISIKFQPKGAGLVQFGSFTNTGCTNVGSILIKDAGGTNRKLMVCN